MPDTWDSWEGGGDDWTEGVPSPPSSGGPWVPDPPTGNGGDDAVDGSDLSVSEIAGLIAAGVQVLIQTIAGAAQVTQADPNSNTIATTAGTMYQCHDGGWVSSPGQCPDPAGSGMFGLTNQELIVAAVVAFMVLK